jgi:hypothetical protein
LEEAATGPGAASDAVRRLIRRHSSSGRLGAAAKPVKSSGPYRPGSRSVRVAGQISGIPCMRCRRIRRSPSWWRSGANGDCSVPDSGRNLVSGLQTCSWRLLIAFHGISSRLVRASRVSLFAALERRFAALLGLTGSGSKGTSRPPRSCFVSRWVCRRIGLCETSLCRLTQPVSRLAHLEPTA